jgi:hypothetical protein
MSDTYELLVRANNTPAVAIGRGASPDKISSRVNRHRAAVVDAELAPLPSPTPDAPVWSVRYDTHGGFVATIASGATDTGPHRGWGYAPTPQSAVATVAGFTPHRPPMVVVDPPARCPAQLAEPSSEADTSLEGQRVRDLLLQRRSAYREHLQACSRAAVVLRDVDIDTYLAERAGLLNDTAPQLKHAKMLFHAQEAANKDHRGFFDTTLWIPTRLVVATMYPTWGDFQGRTRLPAPWLIRAPELAAAGNAYYEALYPGALATLGIPAEVGTDAAAWARWLTTTG